MAGLYYDPRLADFASPITEGITEGMKIGSLQQDRELKKLQTKRLYDQLQAEQTLRETLQGNQDSGLYSPQAVTAPATRMATSSEFPESQEWAPEPVQIQQPTGEVKPAESSPWLDSYKFWAARGDATKAAESLKLHEADQLINSKDGHAALKDIFEAAKAYKGKVPPGVMNMINTLYGSQFKKFGIKPEDLTFATKNGVDIASHPVPGDDTKKIVITTIPGEDKAHINIVSKDENKTQTDEQLISKSLEEKLGRKPTATEVLDGLNKMKKERIQVSVNVHQGAKIEDEKRLEEKGFKTWTDEEKKGAFESLRWTGKRPSFGFRDLASRNAFEKELSAYREENGGARQWAADQAKFKADTASYQNVKKAADLTNVAIQQTDHNATALQVASDAYTRSNYPGPNRIINWTAEQFGDPKRQAEFAQFKLGLMAFSREYMRVVTGAARSVAELTIGAQQSADDILSKFSSWETLKAQVAQAKIEIQNVNKAYKDTLRNQSVDLYGRDPAQDSAIPNSGRQKVDPKKVKIVQ